MGIAWHNCSGAGNSDGSSQWLASQKEHWVWNYSQVSDLSFFVLTRKPSASLHLAVSQIRVKGWLTSLSHGICLAECLKRRKGGLSSGSEIRTISRDCEHLGYETKSDISLLRPIFAHIQAMLLNLHLFFLIKNLLRALLQTNIPNNYNSTTTISLHPADPLWVFLFLVHTCTIKLFLWAM